MAVGTRAAAGGRGAEGRWEVFPRLGMYVAAGLMAGLVASSVAGRFVPGLPHGQHLTTAGLGLGAILGLFVGLGRGVWRPGRPAAPHGHGPPEPSMRLWDAWLDDGRDLEPAGLVEVAEPESEPAPVPVPVAAAVSTPAPAPVRPRVISPRTGEAIRLDDELGTMIAEGRGGVVVIRGGPGSGKTTARRHLASVLPPWARGRVLLVEQAHISAISADGTIPLVIVFSDGDPGQVADLLRSVFRQDLGSPQCGLDYYDLAPWSQDDAIEYMLATDRDACASVMGRLRRSKDFDYLDGIPELVAVVLDRMARDESIADVRAALRGELANWIGADAGLRERMEYLCLEAALKESDGMLRLHADKVPLGPGRLIRHRPAALLVAADRVAAVIKSGRLDWAIAGRHSPDMVREVARRIAGNAEALAVLAGWLLGYRRGLHSLAASLLHAATPGWRPDRGQRPKLEGAYLAGASWDGLDLSRFDLRSADLSGAGLREANLEKSDVGRAGLDGADLQGAILRYCRADAADLSRANLAHAQASAALFQGANLSGACLAGAHLWKADLTAARIDGANFTEANLEDACLTGLPLRLARFADARFGGADLGGCDMAGMELPGADLHDARLRNADLTSTRMPGANLTGADLRNARLAGVSWRGASLRDADLRGASFHLGSSRSGMIDSPIACEGSRTGFHTDDFLDSDIKPADEIRKADLRDVDLLGADIWDVDFDLVDLRGACYSRDQAVHLRFCGAILDEGR